MLSWILRVQDGLWTFKCKKCGRKYKKEFDRDLKEQIPSLYRLSDGDGNKFSLILTKGVYHGKKWMVGKNLMKDHHWKKRYSTVP